MRPSSTPHTMEAKLSSRKIISAASLDRAEPVMLMAIPMSAFFKAGESLTSSPVTATISLRRWQFSTMMSFCWGDVRASTTLLWSRMRSHSSTGVSMLMVQRASAATLALAWGAACFVGRSCRAVGRCACSLGRRRVYLFCRVRRRGSILRLRPSWCCRCDAVPARSSLPDSAMLRATPAGPRESLSMRAIETSSVGRVAARGGPLRVLLLGNFSCFTNVP